MHDTVDSPAVQSRERAQHAGGVLVDWVIPEIAVGPERFARVPRRERDGYADASSLRVIAASALVVGLLLYSAPAALAQVGQLLSTDPAAHPQDDPVSLTSYRPAKNSALYLPRARSTTPLIKWDGTAHALKCSFRLLTASDVGSCSS
jgi:hypothetical protein